MSRLQISAFVALLAATVAAFFIVQHLKTQDPLIQGNPAPVPSAFDPINGVAGPGEPKSCMAVRDGVRQPVNYRHVFTTFYLQHQPDHVTVEIVDTAENVVATLASNYNFKRIDVRNPPNAFVWNGRNQTTGQIAPDGTYYFKVIFQSQDRTIQIDRPIQLTTQPPRPKVLSVTPALISPVGATGSSGLNGTSGQAGSTKISYGGNNDLSGYINVIRTDLPGGPKQVFSFRFRGRSKSVTWNGRIHGQPAPAGTYLIGMRVLDAACHLGTFPAENPPVPGTTQHAGVTVRYLAAEVPNVPAPAGGHATVFVDSRQHLYSWKLFRPGFTRVLTSGQSSSYTLNVPLPASGPGVYGLSLSYPGQHTLVPLVASPVGVSPHPVLVVVPSLTWQGENPVDDPPDYDGIPNTLTDGGPITLARPLVTGLPSDFADVSALLTELDHAGFHYDLTTDLGLLADPALLTHHQGVVFAGSERWMPAALATQLKSYVQAGGHVLAIGTDSMQSTVQVAGGQASSPTALSATDLFGARRGQIVTRNKSYAFKFSDPLGLFSGGSGAFQGIHTFQSIQPPTGVKASTAGISAILPAIVGFRQGAGTVIEVGLDNYGLSLKQNPDYRSLLARAWRLLGS